MADLVPADGALAAPAAAPPASLLSPLTDPAGGSALTRIGAFAAQPAVRRTLPAFVGLLAVGGAALAWAAMSPAPQRTLYASLADGERAGVVDALDQAGIAYAIDNSTGSLTVAEGDFYKARMLVAADGALATPETGQQMIDSLPMGASRTLEGQRLRAARERDLEMTVREIDGVESVRVHLAEAQPSVFVRDNVPPSASVMVRLARGRQLSAAQVTAVVNLVAGSVPGLTPEAVRVVDQHGALLSDASARSEDDRLDLQSRMEDKLRLQVGQLLAPMLGQGNFSTEVQVELDMSDVTSARETYDKDGVVRSETQEQSQSSASGAAGVPGVLSNTPPPQTQAVPGAPQGTQPPPGQTPANGESSSSRTYELGREVSVSNIRPGGVRRLSVAVALSKGAMKGAKPQDLKDLEALVSAAVGANAQRGDQVKVVMRTFEPAADAPPAFYETAWFATLVRNGAAVLAVLLTLLIGVRPMIKALRGDAGAKTDKPGKSARSVGNEDKNAEDDGDLEGEAPAPAQDSARPEIPGAEPEEIARVPRAELISAQVNLAQRLVAEQPDRAVEALRQMLAQPDGKAAA